MIDVDAFYPDPDGPEFGALGSVLAKEIDGMTADSRGVRDSGALKFGNGIGVKARIAFPQGYSSGYEKRVRFQAATCHQGILHLALVGVPMFKLHHRLLTAPELYHRHAGT
jgi:hypothetical protein